MSTPTVQSTAWRIFNLTDNREKKPLCGIMNHLTQEVGELAEAVEVAEGFSTKVLKEPLVGEVADVIQCALSVLAKATKGMSNDERMDLLSEHLSLKTNKWENQIVQAEHAAMFKAQCIGRALRPTTKPEAKVIDYNADTAAKIQEVGSAGVHKLVNILTNEGVLPKSAKWGGAPSSAKIQVPDTRLKIAAPPVVDQLESSAVFARLRQVFAEQLGMEEQNVMLHSHFIADLGCDSLDTIELVMAVEDEYNLEIPDEDAEKISTVRQAVEYVQKRLKERGENSTWRETGKLYVDIRKHPSGLKQPTGKRVVRALELIPPNSSNNHKTQVRLGIGDGKQGWVFYLDGKTPGFLTFRKDKETGPAIDHKEALEYWARHHP